VSSSPKKRGKKIAGGKNLHYDGENPKATQENPNTIP